MKKNEIKVVAILAAAVILLSAALVFMDLREKKAPAVNYLMYLAEDDIVKLDFANTTDYVHLEQSGGKWVLSDDSSFKVNQNAAQTLLRALTNTKIIDTIDVSSQTQLKEYSLLTPQCIIEFTDKAGASHSIHIGVLNSLTEQIYLLFDSLETVYITSPEIGQAFGCTKLDIMEKPSIPTPSDGQTEVSIVNRNGSFTISRDGDKWYYEKDGEKTEVDDGKAYDFYFLTWDMHWRGVIEHNAKDLGKYDLSKPRISYTLKYNDGTGTKVFELELGSSLPDGTCYAKIKNDNDIFLLDALMADWLEGIKEGDFK